MQKHEMIIYEYKDNYYFIERGKQNSNAEISASENTALSSILPVGANAEEVGSAVLKALGNYDKTLPDYSPWQLKELRKQLCNWVGARGYPTLVKNSRLVLVVKDFEKDEIVVIPFDNNNINPWETMLEDKAQRLPVNSSENDIGKAIEKAFTIATYHPDRSQ